MKKTLFVVIAFLMAMLMMLPAWAFVDVDTETYDEQWEMFGPHIDKIFIKMYGGQNAEFTALLNSEIDLMERRLTWAEYEQIVNAPNIAVLSYPVPPFERSYFEIVINQNNETTLGPPGPPDPNPKWPNPTADVDLRIAFAKMINRTYLESVTEGFVVSMKTEIVPSMVGWVHIDPPIYEYSLEGANATLDAGGFPTDPATGWRYPDFNENGVHDPGEMWDSNDALDVYIRTDWLSKICGEYLYIIYVSMWNSNRSSLCERR